ncbi:hypothetical protein CAFE_03660 [Caprobacter fermentans]|uniref:DUF1697 domain-containing protein n=1 Tax=Caproicibacter fermentans TaxID=2576756 RepID=A0A6N8HV89_9FIRM|nr:DUF1697 domain-containing protein [Caproicibacter fermentans]MVB09701.1 hypothetical protein [Caproicibacter fermentans]
MKRYIAFLRGINVGGKNKIKMSELKAGFEELGFLQVRTYLNSGNIIFSSDKNDNETFSGQLERMIKDRFNLDIPVFVILKEDLEDILRNAPGWWNTGKKEIYDNLIFIIPSTTFTEVFSEIGEPKEEFEKITGYKKAAFWSFSRKDYQKTNWWSRTARASISSRLTIRTANTVKKIVEM